MYRLHSNVSDADQRAAGSPICVALADPRLKSRLIQALTGTDIELRGCAPSSDDVMSGTPGVDVVVLYRRGDSGQLLDYVRSTKEAFPGAALIVVWPPSEDESARRALRAGADGVVSEAELETTLAATIHAAVSGLVCIPRSMRRPLESESLSMREKQVLGMLVMGLSNAEIANRLYLAESTVKSHLSSAYTKLGVRSRKAAAAMILDPTEGLGPGILAISAA